MNISHLTPTFADIKTWVRAATVTVNQLITGKQDKSDNLTSLSGLDLTGHSGDAVVVTAGEDGFELVTVATGSGIADGDYGDIIVSGSGTAFNFDTGVVTAFAKTFLDDANAAAVRTTIGAQASGSYAVTTNNLSDLSNAGTARTNLGLAIGTDVLGMGGGTLTGDLSVPDEAYDATNWNGSTEVPTKNAVRDKFESLSAGSGRLIGRQLFTSGSGTYTPTSGTGSVVIELVGGGGGGSGVAAPGGSNGTRGGSGGGGAYLMKRLTANFSGASYSVGAKGTGGASGANSGTAGSSTTFTDTAATVYTAGGGAAGATQTAVGPVSTGVSHTGGSATNGDINVGGGDSDPPMVLITSGGGLSGRGGTSRFSPGGGPVRINAANTGAAGKAASGYGGGGSAAYAQGTGGPFAGGDGADGFIIIWEYS